MKQKRKSDKNEESQLQRTETILARTMIFCGINN